MKIATILTIISAVILTACSSSINSYEPKQSDIKNDFIKAKQVITDSSLDDIAHLEYINKIEIEGGLLKIQAKLKNLTSFPQKIRYKFSWIDKNGMAFENSIATVWKVAELEGGESCFISTVSESPNAKDFTLQILPEER